MKRTPLAERKLPDYTRGEELFNMISHITGGALGILALILCLCLSALYHNPYGVFGGLIFSLSMILLYTMSSIYHGLRPNTMAKKVFQVIDHCTIYLLIAGTYTAVALQMMRIGYRRTAWTVLGVIWALAVLGIVLNAIDLHSFRYISMLLYLGMGWCILSVSTPSMVIELLGFQGTLYMLTGGIAYTVGVLFYSLGRNHRYMHSVFHIFCVVGSLFQLMSVLCFLR